MRILSLAFLLPVSALASDIDVEARAILQAAEIHLSRTIADVQSLYDDQPEFLHTLRQSQIAWEKHRDAMLELRFPKAEKQEEYGSVFPAAYAIVKADLTERRASELEEWATGVDEGDVASGSVMGKQEIEERKANKAVDPTPVSAPQNPRGSSED